MGKLETFTVVFSTEPPVYFPGQTVQGVVNVTLNEDMKMKNIRLLYQGKAYVSLESEKVFNCKVRIRNSIRGLSVCQSVGPLGGVW